MKWEYHTSVLTLQQPMKDMEHLDKMGEKRWELTAAIRLPDDKQLHYIFKREKIDE